MTYNRSFYGVMILGPWARTMSQGRRNVKCGAIDATRFKFSPVKRDVSAKLVLNPNRLVDDFLAYFPNINVTTVDQVLLICSRNPQAREWYVAWKKADALVSDAPEWLDMSKEDDRKVWDQAREKVAEFRKRESERQKRVEQKAKELRDMVEAVAQEKTNELRAFDHITQISLLTVNHLPLDAQARVAVSPNSAEEAKKELLAYQKLLRSQAGTAAFKSPF